MHISKLKIKNFKCFDEVEIIFDPNFNLIIGENNSGKSTIFDGLRLWQLAFQKFLKDRTNNQQSSFYASQFYSFTIDDISFLRILDFKNDLEQNYAGKKVLVVTHSGVVRLFLQVILDFPIKNMFTILPDYGKRCILKKEGGLWKILALNI